MSPLQLARMEQARKAIANRFRAAGLNPLVQADCRRMFELDLAVLKAHAQPPPPDDPLVAEVERAYEAHLDRELLEHDRFLDQQERDREDHQ